MIEKRRFRIWLPSMEVLVVLGLGLVIPAVVLPGVLSSQRAARERNASIMLKTFISAEADFQANDRDGNKVMDFWTGDVSGLYYVKSAKTGKEVRLLDLSTADADGAPLFPLPGGTVSKGEYFYRAMDRDDTLEGPGGVYRTDTDGSGRKVHHLSKFGCCAYPRDTGAGTYTFYVNENGAVWRHEGTTPILGWSKNWVNRSGPLD
jgi:hypothetical protein